MTPAIDAGKVLVVDNDPIDVEEMSSLLRREGYRVVTASDGTAVATLIARERPDVVVLDVALPGVIRLRVVPSAEARPLRRDHPDRADC